MRVRGASLLYSTTENGTYTAVGGEENVDAPNETFTTYDDTTLDTAGDIRDMQVGEIELGQVSFTYKFTPARCAAIEALKGLSRWWKYQLPKDTGQSTSGDSWKFQGSLLNNQPPASSNAQNQRATCSGTIVVQSRPARTAGS